MIILVITMEEEEEEEEGEKVEEGFESVVLQSIIKKMNVQNQRKPNALHQQTRAARIVWTMNPWKRNRKLFTNNNIKSTEKILV
jgi:hypothetical protein